MRMHLTVINRVGISRWKNQQAGGLFSNLSSSGCYPGSGEDYANIAIGPEDEVILLPPIKGG